jgi:hypothetical protein
MKINLKQFSQYLGIHLVLLTATVSWVHGAAADTKGTNAKPTEAKAADTTNTAPTEAVPPKSIFEDDLKSGKDPFFPKSVRRMEKVPLIAEKPVAPLTQLVLKGITGPANRRLALINNQPIAAGETAFVKIGTGQVRIHCWEIGANHAVISVEGEPERKELRLREGL